jgi:TonB family protein
MGSVEHNGSTGSQAEWLAPAEHHKTDSAANMANDFLVQSDSESEAAAVLTGGHELDALLGRAFEEKPIWAGLYESLRDVFFPPKLPPLELTSTPIPVPDPMAVKPNPWAIGISTGFNVLVVLALLYLGITAVVNKVKPKEIVTPIEITKFDAPKAAVDAGGGGGAHDNMEAEKGKIPPRAKPMEAPKLDEPPVPTIDVQKEITIPDNPSLVNFGQSKSANVKMASLGNGNGGGLGNGSGSGYGNGYGGNIGGGIERIGGRVSAPTILHSVDPEFSDEARRAKYQGLCLISLIVDAQGNPQDIHVARVLGMGLDEKAIEAVKQFKFKPAMKDGKTPVPVRMTIEINFHLY